MAGLLVIDLVNTILSYIVKIMYCFNCVLLFFQCLPVGKGKLVIIHKIKVYHN